MSNARNLANIIAGTYDLPVSSIDSVVNLGKNRIINGAMMIDQRNAGAALTVNNTALFTLDRWMVEDGTTTGVLSAQQVSDAPAGFINSLKVTASTGTGTIGANEYAVITQFIEGLNCSDLAWGSSSASSVTVSFWVKASNTGNYSCTLYNHGASRINPQSFTVNSANTWEQKTITFTGDTTGTWLTTNGRGIIVNFYMTLGSTYLSTAGWNGSSKYGVTGQGNALTTTNNTFQITGVQLEKGSTATSFDYRPYGTELALCQRYYQQIGGSSYTAVGTGINYSGAQVVRAATVIFITTMRTAPTAAISGSLIATDRTGFDTPISSISGVAAGTDSLNCYFAKSATSGTDGYPAQIAVANGSTGYVTLSAEL